MMRIPWYGYLLSILGFYGIGYYSGLKAGAGVAIQGILAQQAKMQQMPGFPEMPPVAKGR